MKEGIEVGKKFPGNLPEGEGLFIGIGPDGLLLFVRINNAERVEAYGWHASKVFPYGLMSWVLELSSEERQKGTTANTF